MRVSVQVLQVTCEHGLRTTAKGLVGEEERGREGVRTVGDHAVGYRFLA